MRRRISTYAVPLNWLLLTVLLASTTVMHAQSPTSSTNSIAGTWSGTWDSIQLDYHFVLTEQFSSDGNFISTETDEFAVSQGVWQRMEPRTFALTAYQYAFGALEQPYQGVFKISAKLKLAADGESFTGIGHLELRDTNGVLLLSDDANMTGSRVHVQTGP